MNTLAMCPLIPRRGSVTGRALALAALFLTGGLVLPQAAIAQPALVPRDDGHSVGIFFPIESLVVDDLNAVRAETNRPNERAAYASKMADSGNYAEALKHYMWCYEHGVRNDHQFIKVVNSWLPAQFVLLGEKYPPARHSLEMQRVALREKILSNVKGAKPDIVVRLAGLDVAVRDVDAAVETLNALPKGSRQFKAYGESVRALLIYGRKYQAALSLGAFEADFNRQRIAAEDEIDWMKGSDRPVPGEFWKPIRQRVALLGSIYVEALAGLGDTEGARKLTQEVLRYHDTPVIRASLAINLRRAGVPNSDALVAAAAAP